MQIILQRFVHGGMQGNNRLFRVFHSCESYPPVVFRQKLERVRERILAIALDDVPGTREAQNMAERFRKHGQAYFVFITTLGIDPTNNQSRPFDSS